MESRPRNKQGYYEFPKANFRGTQKTTNIALLSETGKLPIIFKIYVSIFKYWLRLKKEPSRLLQAALETNEKYENNKHLN